jgi:stearoyl-CoA desaturase (delta-9 desaturase)
VTNSVVVQEEAQSRPLVCISSILYDASDIMTSHPGGKTLIKLSIGKDVSYNFNGGVYYHSRGARNLLMKWRVARVLDVPDLD